MIEHNETNLNEHDIWITHILADGTECHNVIKNTVIPNMPIDGCSHGFSTTKYFDIVVGDDVGTTRDYFERLFKMARDNMGPILDGVDITVSEFSVDGRDVHCVVHSSESNIKPEILKRLVVQCFNFYYDN